MTHAGSCHCGRIAFTADGDVGQLMECNCSYCSRRGALLWFVPRSQFRLTTPESELGVYTFNKHVIRHHFCPTCGCTPFSFGKDPSGNEIAAVNVRCLPDLDRADLKVVPFDGRKL